MCTYLPPKLPLADGLWSSCRPCGCKEALPQHREARSLPEMQPCNDVCSCMCHSVTNSRPSTRLTDADPKITGPSKAARSNVQVASGSISHTFDNLPLQHAHWRQPVVACASPWPDYKFESVMAVLFALRHCRHCHNCKASGLSGCRIQVGLQT